MVPHSPSDPEPRSIRLPTGLANITDVGEGLPVVAIHGLPGSVRDFRWLGSCIEDQLRFIRVDLPGFGGTSVEVAPGTRIEDHAKFVIEVIETLGLKRFVVLGHSAGGPIVAEVANRLPDNVAGVCLISSAGLRPHRLIQRRDRFKWISRGLRVPGLATVLTKAIRKQFERAGFPNSITDDALRQTIHGVAAMDFAIIRKNLVQLPVSTFVAWADDDRLIPSEIYQQLSQACPAGPQYRFETGGHNIQKTRAVELGESIVAWIDGLDA